MHSFSRLLFLLNIQFPQTPTNTPTRVFGVSEVREQRNVACTAQTACFKTLRSFFLLQSLLFFKHPFLPPFLTFQVTAVLFPALSVFNSLFQACFTFPPILLSVQPSMSFLSPSPAPSLNLLLLLLAVALHIAVCKQKNK